MPVSFGSFTPADHPKEQEFSMNNLLMASEPAGLSGLALLEQES